MFYNPQKELLSYIANAYCFLLDYKLNKNETSKKMFFKCKFEIKHLTHLSMTEINDIFYSISAYNSPIKKLYTRFLPYIQK